MKQAFQLEMPGMSLYQMIIQAGKSIQKIEAQSGVKANTCYATSQPKAKRFPVMPLPFVDYKKQQRSDNIE
jgi:hypothetical protein